MAEPSVDITVVIGTAGVPVGSSTTSPLVPSTPITIIPTPPSGLVLIPVEDEDPVPPPVVEEDITVIPPSEGPITPTSPLVIIKPNTVPDFQAIAMPGDAAAPSYLSAMRAGDTDLERFRAVTLLSSGLVTYMDPTDVDHRRGYLGITLNPAVAGRKTTIVTQGTMVNSAWDFVPGVVHSTANGVLTQTLTGDTYEVATAMSSDTIYVGRSVSEATPGAVETFIYTSPSSTDSWLIEHNLGRYPIVTVVDSANTVIWAEVSYLDINTVRVDFAFAMGGTAYLV